MSCERLIFISGWATGSSCWDPVINKIDRPVSCCYVKWWECLNEAAEENALLRVLEREAGRVIIVGWSLGTLVALEGATLKPGSVKKLVLVSGTPRMTSTGNYPGVDSSVLRAMHARFSRTPRLVLEEFARFCIGDGLGSSIEADELLRKFVDGAEGLNVEHLARGLRYLQEKDLRNILPEIKVPVHLLHGDSDRIIPVECARFMERTIPEARLDQVQGGSHALLLTAPYRVAGLIRDVIDAGFSSQ